MKFTVKRSHWHRGNIDSALLMPTGRKCCIGFVCQQVGLKNKDIASVGDLQEVIDSHAFGDDQHYKQVPRIKKALKKFIRSGNFKGKTLGEAYEVNDSPHMDDPTRENKLKRIFKRLGHTVKFV